MKRFQIYTERQREEINNYLRALPPAMPAYVRQLRMAAKKTDLDKARKEFAEDLEQAMKDLDLMQKLADLEVPIGRKDTEYKEMYAKMVVRQGSSRDKKASLRVRDR